VNLCASGQFNHDGCKAYKGVEMSMALAHIVIAGIDCPEMGPDDGLTAEIVVEPGYVALRQNVA
jgi:hypothetical protein